MTAKKTIHLINARSTGQQCGGEYLQIGERHTRCGHQSRAAAVDQTDQQVILCKLRNKLQRGNTRFQAGISRDWVISLDNRNRLNVKRGEACLVMMRLLVRVVEFARAEVIAQAAFPNPKEKIRFAFGNGFSSTYFFTAAPGSTAENMAESICVTEICGHGFQEIFVEEKDGLSIHGKFCDDIVGCFPMGSGV